jgi:hypothetical protein
MHFYKDIDVNRLKLDDIYSEICWIVYNSGFKLEIVSKYWPKISRELLYFDVDRVFNESVNNPQFVHTICYNSGFNSVKKAEGCVFNSGRLIEIESSLALAGGIRGFFIQLSQLPNDALLDRIPFIADYLHLKGIGKVTIYHLLKNMGVDIFKPDIHVCRMLTRLNLINQENTISDISQIMIKLSRKSGLSLCELDTLLFNYGKISGDSLDLIQ